MVDTGLLLKCAGPCVYTLTSTPKLRAQPDPCPYPYLALYPYRGR